MTFHIKGAQKDTGEEVQLTIEAHDQAAAEDWAAQHGILWTAITPHVMARQAINATKGGFGWRGFTLGIGLGFAISKPVVEPIAAWIAAELSGSSSDKALGATMAVFPIMVGCAIACGFLGSWIQRQLR